MLGLPLLALVLLIIFAATGSSIESILDRAIARNAQLQSQAMRLALEQALEETRNQLLILAAGSMASTLSAMSGQCDISLGSAVHSIAARIEKELGQHARGDVSQFTLPLSEVDASMLADKVRVAYWERQGRFTH